MTIKTNKQEIIKKVSQIMTAKKLMIKEGIQLIYAGGIYRVIQIGNKKPYAAITAFRKEYSLEENRKRNKKLLESIKSMGLNTYSLIGFFKECPTNKPNCSDNEKIKVEEESFFVPYREDALSLKKFIENLTKLGKTFGQDSVLIGLPSSYSYEKEELEIFNYKLKTGYHYYLTPSAIEANIGKKVTPKKLEDYGSIAIDPKKDRKIEWLITGVKHPINVMSRMKFKAQGLTWCEGLDEKNMTYLDIKDF